MNMKYCPFCGSAANLTANEDVFVHTQKATVECSSCSISMMECADTLDGAIIKVIAKWNCRWEE